MTAEWSFEPAVLTKAQEIGIGARVAVHWSEAECQDQEGTVVGVEIHRYGKVGYTVHIDGDISPTDGFTHDRTGVEGGTIRLIRSQPAGVRVTGLECFHEWFDCSNSIVIPPAKSCRKCGWTVGADESVGMFVQWPWLEDSLEPQQVEAEPIGIVVPDGDGDLMVYWYEGHDVQEGDEVYAHPTPAEKVQESQTVSEEMVERAVAAETAETRIKALEEALRAVSDTSHMTRDRKHYRLPLAVMERVDTALSESNKA